MSKTSNFILGFAMGVGTVLATTKFLSSESGKMIRKQLQDVGQDLKERVTDYYEYAGSAAEDVKESAAGKWDELSGRFKNGKSSDFVDPDEEDADLEFDLDEDGKMHPATKEDTSEFQQATTSPKSDPLKSDKANSDVFKDDFS